MLEGFFDYTAMALGIGFGVFGTKLVPYRERARIERGDSVVAQYVERNGDLLDKELVPLLERPTRLRLAAVALRADLRGSSLFVIAFIVLMLVAGPLLDDSIRPTLGGLAALVYLWAFVKHVSTLGRAADGEVFTAMLDVLPDPTWYSWTMASAKLADGSAFAIGVHWRLVESLRRRGDVELVLLGSMSDAGNALFIGVRSSPRAGG
jgi:hypothetical protein